MLTERITNRWQAFAIHLIISIGVFAVLAALIYRWYPGVLFKYDGGLEGIKLIAGVDLVIGPLLTLLVFNRAKKSLKMDLSIIAALQVLCLIGGMWTIHQTRPVAVVYADGAFRSFPYQYYKAENIDIAQHALLRGSWPVWVYVEGREQEQFLGVMNQKAFLLVDNYRALDAAASERIIAAGKTAEKLSAFSNIRKQPALRDAERYYIAGLGAGGGFIRWDGERAQALDFIPNGERSTGFTAIWQRITSWLPAK